MDKKEIETIQKFLNKLSAMRATLSDIEQALLDELVTGEVTAHSMKPRPVATLENAVDDVAAHSMKPRPEATLQNAITPLRQFQIEFDEDLAVYQIFVG